MTDVHSFRLPKHYAGDHLTLAISNAVIVEVPAGWAAWGNRFSGVLHKIGDGSIGGVMVTLQRVKPDEEFEFKWFVRAPMMAAVPSADRLKI